jgi:acyl transferase domain-containing protein
MAVDESKEAGRSDGTPMAHGEVMAPIAIVGTACRLPGASGPQEFWRLLSTGTHAVGEIPESRRGHAEGLAQGAFLDRVDAFDPEFFGIAPREAALMDPQQRLMLELSWEALENAGIVPATLRDTRTAVFASAIWDDYAELVHRHGGAALASHTFTGTRRALLANRVSYALKLTGPSLTVDSGQSSSLVAVHMACESLRHGEASMALVGGVNLIIAPGSNAISVSMGALSPTGRCRTFDAAADGYVRGEGGAVVVLKPLERALADGDTIHCVIRGSAVNNDGGGHSLRRPRRKAQENVLRLAYQRAGTRPAEVGYVELHGPGTPTGDPVEAAALGAVVGAAHPAGEPVRVGSVKSNLGHLEGAAGIVGLLKVVLSIRHRELPPSLHFTRPNPGIPLDELNIRVHTERGPWPSADGPLVAGVSSFGLGGTNCHVVLAEPDHARDEAGARPDGPAAATPLPWVISGHSPQALRDQAAALRRDLLERPGRAAQDLGLSLATTRSRFAHRAVLIGSGQDQLVEAAAELSRGEPGAHLVQGVAGPDHQPVFVFPGQGSQWRGMALELREQSAVFGAALDECAEVLEPLTGRELLTDMLADMRGETARDEVVQPALWAVMVALARLWESFGVVPSAVVGHSQGEIAAATVAGALSLEDAARIVVVRSRILTQRAAGRGGMASVPLPVDEVEKRLAEYGGRLTVGAVNGPAATVISGESRALAEVMAALEAEEVSVRTVPIAYASHSAQIDDIAQEIAGTLADVRPRPCRIPFHSTVTRDVMAGPELDAAYWARNLRQAVRFSDAVGTLLEAGHTTFIEISPHPVLCLGVSETAEALGMDVGATGSLRRDDGGLDRFMTSAAQAWVRGVRVAWPAAFDGLGPRRVELPTYAFQRTSHWLPVGDTPIETSAARPEEARPRHGDAEPPAIASPLEDLIRGGADQRRRRLLDLVRRHTAAVLGYADPGRVAAETTFKDAGFDSHMSVELRDRLSSATGVRLPSTIIFRHPTPARLADHLDTEFSPGDDGSTSSSGPLSDLDRLRTALLGGLGDEGERRTLADGLRRLLREFDGVGGADDGGVAGAVVLTTTVDDELFALIDEELGIE